MRRSKGSGSASRRSLAGLVLIVVASSAFVLQGDLRGDIRQESRKVQEQIAGSKEDSNVAEDASTESADSPARDSIEGLTDVEDDLLQDYALPLLSSGELVVTVEEGGVAVVAERLLESYQRQGDCVLEQSGYLDLFGSVWGCVISGGRWVNVCLVSDAGDGTSRLSVLYLDADDVAGELLEGDVNVGGGL